MKNASVKWGPAIHRFGQQFDHGLLSATWHWKTRRTNRKKTPDFKKMTSQSWTSFDDCLRMKLQEKYETRATDEATTATTIAAKREEQCVGETRADKEYEDITTATTEAIEEIVPKKDKSMYNGRHVSEATKKLFEDRIKAFAKTKPSTKERQKRNKKIRRECRNDYRAWVTKWTEIMEAANNRGDAKEIYRGVRAISGAKRKMATKTPTLKKDKSRIASPEELASVWAEFLEKKFQQTELEQLRKESDALPQCTDPMARLQRKEFEDAVNRMKNGKAMGEDGVPAEVWKYSAVAKEALFEFLQKESSGR